MTHSILLFLRRNRRHVAELLLASLLVNSFMLALPLFSMLVYDKAIGNQLHDTLWALAAGMALLFGFEICMRISRVLLVEHAGARWDAHLDERVARGILAAPLSKPMPVGDVLARYREVASTRDALSAQFLLPLADFPFLLMFLGAIAFIGGPLVLIPLTVGSVLLVSTSALQALAQRSQREANRSQSAKLTWLVDVLAARASLMTPAAATVAAEGFKAPSTASARAAARARLWSQVSVQIVPVAVSFSTVALLVAGAYRVEAQALSVGGLTSCSLLGSRVLNTFCSFAPLITRWKEFVRALRELSSVVDLDAAAPQAAPERAGALASEGIRLDGVGFHYAGQERAVLDDVSLHLKPGELVVLVGASGAGKSSLLRLLAGHMAPSRGRFSFGGRLIDDDTGRRWLCSQASLKPQDPSFLRGRIKDVVAPGALGQRTADASDAASDAHAAYHCDAGIAASLRSAGFGPVLERSELGLDSEVGTNGAGLSGGQRQMLALARAFHSGSDLLLLDEPTLGLDRPAQEAVIAALGPLKAGRCVVVGTHATELIERADRVLVLDRGKLVADTTPQKLFGEATARARAAAPAAPNRQTTAGASPALA